MVKTKNTKSGNKVFINICVSPHGEPVKKGTVNGRWDGTGGYKYTNERRASRPDKDKRELILGFYGSGSEVVKDSKGISGGL